MILQDTVVIITGVGPGMGSKLALEGAKAGAKVVMMARSTELPAQLQKEIAAAGGEAIAVSADVTKPADCARTVQAAVDAYGRVDGLINCAYRQNVMTPFEDVDLDDWRASFEVNLFGALNMVKAVIPVMKEKGGAIVNVGTMETRKPLPGNGSYNVPKSALQGATRQLATELAKYHIRVNSAVIGWMWGKPVENYFAGVSQQTGVPVAKLKADRDATILLGKIPPDEECAKSVLMLLSDYSSQMTGAAVDINGGDFFNP